MKTILIYASVNPQGSSSKIAEELKKSLQLNFDLYNVVEQADSKILLQYDLLFFLVATYGDQELQPDIENFITSSKDTLKDKKFMIIEIGNYYGYDDYSFGSGMIIKKLLESNHASEFCKGLSMDTLPLLDWTALQHWIKKTNPLLHD